MVQMNLRGMDKDTVKIICKCIPGFENIAIDECKEKFQIVSHSDIRGRIYFDFNLNDISKLQELCSISHYWVVAYERDDYFESGETNEAIFSKLQLLPTQICWTNALRTWKVFKDNFDNSSAIDLSCDKKDEDEFENAVDKTVFASDSLSHLSLDNKFNGNPLTAAENLSFRVTATRTGEHSFSSMESALHLGSGIQEMFQWKVDLTKFDIEVVSYILNKSISIGIQLTRDSQSSRNIIHFGPTTLKANIAYCLLKFAQVSEGDIVCDPMCGGGSINVEGALSFPSSFQIGGDNHPIGIQYAAENMEAVEKRKGSAFTSPTSFLRWDVYQLPLRTGSVDRIVTDLPFGKRIGNKERNLFLYPVVLKEMARICRPHGKAALLTQHKGAIAKALRKCPLWKSVEVRRIFMGGLDVSVYLLRRTEEKHMTASSP